MERNMAKAAGKPVIERKTSPNLRFERKFTFPNANYHDIVQRVLQNSFGFKEVFHQRKINNVYFDDSNYNFYKQNVEGVANRKKLRLRWYGNQTNLIKNPTIEIKKKMGEIGDKESHKLPGKTFDINEIGIKALYVALLENTAKNPALNNLLKDLHPTLLNTYERRYFLSFCGRYRITVDFNQNFYNPNYTIYPTSELSLHNTVVVELKYTLDNDDDARLVSQQLGTRLSKNSKYVTGVNLLYHPIFQ